MCGVIGVISKDNQDYLSTLIANGLYQVQNRGDFSAGIATIKRLPINRQKYRRLRAIASEEAIESLNPLKFYRNYGKVADVFNETILEKLTGFMGVGQVRYPTAGYTADKEAGLSEEERNKKHLSSIQPLISHHYKLAWVHNGDIGNYHEIMDYYEKEGLTKGTYNDLEALSNVFEDEFFSLSQDMDIFNRIERSAKKTLETVTGTYSSLAMINNVGLIALRDKNGRKPLYYGVRKDDDGNISEYAFASETVALEKMLFKGTSEDKRPSGKPAYEELNPGEFMFVSKNFEVYKKQVVKKEPKFCPFEGAYFERAPSYINNKRVKHVRWDIIKSMWDRFSTTKKYAQLMERKDNLIIVPVPRTAETAGKYLAKYADIEYCDSIEKHPFSPRVFMQPTPKHREHNTIADHYVYEEEVMNKDILLIDDSIVRGTTFKHLINYLKDVGVNSIHAMITFPTIVNTCNHAVDFKKVSELFASNKTNNQLKSELGLNSFDSLIYCTPNDLKQALGINSLCDECYKV